MGDGLGSGAFGQQWEVPLVSISSREGLESWARTFGTVVRIEGLVSHSQREQILGAFHMFVHLPEPDFVLLEIEEPIVVEPKWGTSTLYYYSSHPVLCHHQDLSI